MSLYTQKEIAKYSATKAFAELSNGPSPGIDGEVTGLERELSEAIRAHTKRTTGTEPANFMMPWGALMPIGKANNATTATAGGFLVDSTLENIVPALRSASVVLDLGAQVFNNVTGDLGVPAETAFADATWLAESDSLSDPSDATYQRTLFTPKRCATLGLISKQLLSQNSLGVENFVRKSLRNSLGTALDKAALNGTGGVQPLGLLNNPAVSTITFSATPTWAKMISFQDTLAAANAGNLDQGSLAYVSSPTSASKMMQTVVVSGGHERFLWTGNEWNGSVCGLPARSTTNVGSGNQVVLGDWSQLVVAFWSEGFSLLADPFTRKKAAIVEFYANLFVDIGPSNAANFVVSTDSGAQ